MLKTRNPSTIAPPAAMYSHSVEIPPNARWLFTAGQVGVRPDGTIPDGFEMQHDQIWKNTLAILADATRACVRAWGRGGGPEIWSLDPEAASDSLTAVLVPQGHDSDRVRAIANDKYSVALGRGLGALQGRIFRIGHMGDLNEPMLLGALGAIELALADAGVPHQRGGVDAAMDSLRAPVAPRKAAVAA